MSDEAQKPVTVRGLLTAFAYVTGFGSILGTLFGFFGDTDWILDLFNHLRPHYVLGSLPLLIFGIVTKRWGELAAGLISVGINTMIILPWMTQSGAPPAKTLRVVHANVLRDNPNRQGTLNALLDLKPDVLVLIEANNEWSSVLAQVPQPYSVVHHETRSDAFGIALLAKVPVENFRLWNLDGYEVPVVEGVVRLSGQPVLLVGVHTVPPVNTRMSKWRNQQLEHLSRRIHANPGESLLVGDLNVTPWSGAYVRFIHAANLISANRGYDATWPAWLGPLGIPIDHSLHTDGLRVADRQILPARGSDHRGVLLDIGFQR